MKDETKDANEDYALRLRAKTYAEAWGKSPNPKEVSLIKLMGGVVAGVTLCFGLLYEVSIFKDKQLQREAKKAQQQYSILEKLADVDGNGKIFDIERTLMFERLDKNNDYHYDLDWRVIQANSNFWDYRETMRIEKAIKLYKHDIKLK